MNSLTNVKNRNDLADFLGIPRKKLSYILFIRKTDSYYSTFKIPKKSGGTRSICAPTGDLKTLQKRLVFALTEHIKVALPANSLDGQLSHAFQKGKDITTNAKIHAGKRFVLNMDLENYFDSFHFGRVQGYFAKNRNFLLSQEVATTIAQIACYQGRLPQGSPCSPIITNLISQILDTRLLKITKKYRVNYTRYADDLTFSTNRRDFLEVKDSFINEIENEIIHSGFSINHKKTRLQRNYTRQEVTGLVVNDRPNINRDYIRKTRAMAHSLYSKGVFYINGKPGTINQLQGRFSFICNINNKCNKDWSTNKKNSSSIIKQYRIFTFFRNLYSNDFPVILTEGKTDERYIRAALMNNYERFPNLIYSSGNGIFKFKIKFIAREKKWTQLLSLDFSGGDSLTKMYNEFAVKNKGKNYSCLEYFKKLSGSGQTSPVFLLLDNETKSDRPLKKFLHNLKKDNKVTEDQLQKDLYLKLLPSDKIYLLTVPLVDGKDECVIEDLFTKETLDIKIKGRTFSMDDNANVSHHYNKNDFSNMVFKKYKTIDFNRFIPLLEAIESVIINSQK